MPRRKQDTPQRLKSKEGLGNFSENKGEKEKSEIRENDVTSLTVTEDSKQEERISDNLSPNTDQTEITKEIMHKVNESERLCRPSRDSTIDTELEQSKDNNSKLPRQSKESEHVNVDNVSASSVLKPPSNVANSTENDVDVEKSRGDTSLLDALADAAASHAASPTLDVKPEARRESPIDSESSMPIKKRGKRIPTPDSHSSHNDVTSTHSTSSEKIRSTEQSSLELEKTPSRQDYSLTNHFPVPDHVFRKTTNEDIRAAASIQHANQLHLMEAMMQRQRQIYEECTDNNNNNWMKLQRNDNNCLSKSKAKRYRWCVQKNQEDDPTSTANNSNSSKHSHHSNHHTTTTTKTSSSSTVPTKSTTNEYHRFNSNISSNSLQNLKKCQTKKQINPMQDKLYGTVFTGASKFRCRDCGNPFNTLVDLTVHMNKTGHYRDQNIAELKGHNDVNSKFTKTKKRSMVEIEEKESAEKVLKCMGCGHSFDSLQDLTVHMIKTKHYEDVPSLRFYSQKNEFCASTNGTIPTPNEDQKIAPSLTQLNNNNISNDRSKDLQTNGHRESPKPEQTAFNHRVDAQHHSMFGGLSNFANMQALAAQSFLAGIPPYLMPMSFPGAMNGYGSANTAFAAAAASLLLSAPWLMQVPGLGANMFSPFFNPQLPFPPSLTSNSGQMSPVTNTGKMTPSSAPESASASPKGRSTPNDRLTPNGRYDDITKAKSQILCCSQCGKSFSSLQKLTNHMREANHFSNSSTLPIDSSHFIQRSDASPNGGQLSRCSTSHSNNSNSGPTSSPLEHLAKLACGKSSLGLLGSSGSVRPNDNSFVPKSSASDRHSPLTRSSQNSSPSRDKYLHPDESFKPTSSESPKTGFDFIKSLETTIQSAISKVNEPSTSPTQTQRSKSSSVLNHRNQNLQKSRNFDFKPFDLQNNHRHSDRSENLNRSQDDVKMKSEITDRKSPSSKNDRHLKRPSSDGEDRHLKNSEVLRSVKMKRIKYSPPLDLSRNFHQTTHNLPNHKERPVEKIEQSGAKPPKKEEDQCSLNGKLVKDPIQCIRDNMKSWFDPDLKRHSKHSLTSKELVKSFQTGERNGKVQQNTDLEKSYNIIKDNHHSPNSKNNTDPLKEMQKIVNSTELARRPESLTELASKDSTFMLNRTNVGVNKRSSDLDNGTNTSETKRYKPESVLMDLVRHENNSPPAVNPLAQMEHLVNLQIGQNGTTSNNLISSNSKKPNLAKPYIPSTSEEDNHLHNGTNPMSALMNLFKGSNNNLHVNNHKNNDRHKNRHHERGDSNTISKPPKKAKRHRNHPDKNNISVEENQTSKNYKNMAPPDETAKLRDKMANFFRSMIAKDRFTPIPNQQHSIKEEPKSPIRDVEYSKTAESTDSPPECKNKKTSSLPNVQEIQLQIIFASHFDETSKQIEIAEDEMKKLSSTTGLELNKIKEWISEVEEQINEKGRCSFMKFSSDSNKNPNYICCYCNKDNQNNSKNLSATDFLKHLSTHIMTDSEKRNESPLKEQIEEDSNHRHQDWKMLYRGAMRFESLKTDGPPTSYSVTAHVTESQPMREFSSPSSTSDDVVTEQRRCGDGLKVTDDSPIQVSG